MHIKHVFVVENISKSEHARSWSVMCSTLVCIAWVFWKYFYQYRLSSPVCNTCISTFSATIVTVLLKILNILLWAFHLTLICFQFTSVQSLSRVQLFATPWIAALQASLSITNSQSSLRFTSIESVIPSSHLILCHPLLLLPPIPPSIKFFSNELTLRMRWPKYWSFSFSILPSKEVPGLISFALLCI